jgi:hypothetical protein
MNFPVFSQLAGKLVFRDGFARDCPPQPVYPAAFGSLRDSEAGAGKRRISRGFARLIGVLGQRRASKPAQQPSKTPNFLCRALMHWRNSADAHPADVAGVGVLDRCEGGWLRWSRRGDQT